MQRSIRRVDTLTPGVNDSVDVNGWVPFASSFLTLTLTPSIYAYTKSVEVEKEAVPKSYEVVESARTTSRRRRARRL